MQSGGGEMKLVPDFSVDPLGKWPFFKDETHRPNVIFVNFE
jgi:hypothetical protein